MSVLIFIVFVVLLRPVLVLLHELGHAVKPLLYGHDGVTINIGSPKSDKKSYSLKVGKVDFLYTGLMSFKSTGYCQFKYLSLFPKLLTVLAGPVASLVAATFFYWIARAEYFSGPIVSGLLVITLFAFFDFIWNLRVIITPKAGSGQISGYSDGAQIYYLWSDWSTNLTIDHIYRCYESGDIATAERDLMILVNREIRFNYTFDNLIQ